jgi:hypothetical protein
MVIIGDAQLLMGSTEVFSPSRPSLGRVRDITFPG